mmetsp:Transcript_9972/g.13697  ORF Transcript_9972/g.13697 Transcript_9972/m.13697 type:complete len:111 (+) Transcript_9972:380-712(+)|eukprot:CAMPEP_0170076574 /NCGR_PEP_ID=MMETSP0019_2-20121128/13556_1 /TAXON_ID=98059 /ORGANISM="Dinobryon sp., Strain UTEXLB2267" /LENGTH=110 /DNA_ID=CAMNT_0010288369 /DNA_START=596 /DNA_END=928 /DNA_ORIENTATION=+
MLQNEQGSEINDESEDDDEESEEIHPIDQFGLPDESCGQKDNEFNDENNVEENSEEETTIIKANRSRKEKEAYIATKQMTSRGRPIRAPSHGKSVPINESSHTDVTVGSN